MLSVYNLAIEQLKNRKNIDFHVKNVVVTHRDGKFLEVLNVHFVNKSQTPITICGLSVSCKNNKDSYGNLRIKLSDSFTITSSGVFANNVSLHSDMFPLHATEYGFAKGLFVSDTQKRIIEEKTICTAAIYTNRGVVNKTFSIDRFCDEGQLSAPQQ